MEPHPVVASAATPAQPAAPSKPVTPDWLREPAEIFAQRVETIAGKQLLSLAIYGYVLCGVFQPEYQAVRSVLVLPAIDLELLKRLATEMRGLGRLHFAAPMIMTPHTIATSRDTFPLELLEIQRWHVTLRGNDPFESLDFSPADIRLQSEHDLRSIHIAMHQGLLMSRGREERLGVLSAELTESLLRVLRGLLWLAGQRADDRVRGDRCRGKARGPRAAGRLSGIDRSDAAGWHKFVRLYDDIQALGQFADAI